MKTQQVNKREFIAQEAGCYFDCARGQYIGEAVIEFAQELGFDVSDADQGNTTPDGEFYGELWEEAENWINANTVVPAGYYWGSNENGDWGLWQCEEEIIQGEEENILDLD